MASTVIKSVRAKTLPEIRIDESVDILHNWIRAIPCECNTFAFANELLCKQYRSVIGRVLSLKNQEQEWLTDGDAESAEICRYRGIEAKRRFLKLVRESIEILSGDEELTDEFVYDANHLLAEIVNELRLMGE